MAQERAPCLQDSAQARQSSRLDLCERVLRIYSPSGEERELVELLKEELEGKGLEPRIDNAGNLICEVGSGVPSLLFCPHLDTVPGKLPVRREGTLLYGRGACDAKGALLSMLFAFEDLASEWQSSPTPKGHLIFAAVVEEEKESGGLNQLIKDEIKADGAIFGEPCGLTKITTGYRGHVPVTFEIATQGGHASAPWLSANAAEVAYSLYELIKKNLVQENKETKNGLEAISVTITEINSGTAHNVVPSAAKMCLDIRIPFGMQAHDVARKVEELSREDSKSKNYELTITFAQLTEPYKTSMDSKIVRAVNRAMLKLGYKTSFTTKSGTGDMNTYALTLGVDALTYGPGESKLSHTDHEVVDYNEIVACSQVLVNSQKEFFALAQQKQIEG